PLQRDGLVRVSGGGRGRLVELAITAKGRKQMEKLAPAWKSAQRAAVKTLGEKRWSAILSDLEAAALALNKYTLNMPATTNQEMSGEMCIYTLHYQTNQRKPPFQIKPHWSPALPPWRGMK